MRCGEAFFSERWVQVFPYEMAPLLCKGTVLRDVGGVTVSYSPSMETYFWGGAVTKSPGFKYLFKQVHATEQEAKLSTACQRVLWAASEASIGWVVRKVTKNGPDDFRWRAPQSVDYYDGGLYERVRISKDGTSIDVDVIEAMGEVTDG
jgi:hypothetical protein